MFRIAGFAVLTGFLVFAVLGMRMNLLAASQDMPGCDMADKPFLMVCPHKALQHVQQWQQLLQIVPEMSVQLLIALVVWSLITAGVVLLLQQRVQHWVLRQRLRLSLSDTIRYQHLTWQFATGIVQPKGD